MNLQPTLALSAVPRLRACVALGGNLGDVPSAMVAALRAVHALPGTAVVAVSSIYETQPVDAAGPNYRNAVAVLDTALGPHELLNALLALELQQGRERPFWHAPRTLDLDLLCHGDAHLSTPTLTLPHPRMQQRAFVLLPLREALSGLPHLSNFTDLPDEAALARMVSEQGVELECGFPVTFGV